ncbi:hypothetical protein CW304_13485 [Bacillus sp. UFRGS-B20]|nr:hypothetical protein CW304_13485 [Bacillus sp. UFRGS-B20]
MNTKARFPQILTVFVDRMKPIPVAYIFHAAKTPSFIRNHPSRKNIRGFLSSNPDLNWIRHDFLLKSRTINQQWIT